MSDKINKIKELIGTDSKVAEEISKYCQKIKTKYKIINMKKYVQENLDKTNDTSIIEQYLDKITELHHKVTNNTKDCHHEVKICFKFEINGVLIDFNSELNEDHEKYLIINIDENPIVNDYGFIHEYCMIKNDDKITNFNLKKYYKLTEMSEVCVFNSYINFDSFEKNYDEEDFNEKNYIKYDKKQELKKGIIDFKLFVDLCKDKFPEANPTQMFDVIMLCLIYCFSL